MFIYKDIVVNDFIVFISVQTGCEESDGGMDTVLFTQMSFVRHHPTARYRPVNLWMALLK